MNSHIHSFLALSVMGTLSSVLLEEKKWSIDIDILSKVYLAKQSNTEGGAWSSPMGVCVVNVNEKFTNIHEASSMLY